MTGSEGQPPASKANEFAARFKLGDELAAHEVRKRVRSMLGFRGYGIPLEERRDLEQTVMAQLWEAVGKPGFDPAAGFWGFVEVVVSRRCVDWLRKRKPEVPLDPTVDGADSVEDPRDRVMRRERAELGEAVLASLSADCQELIRLHLAEGQTYAEASETLGASEGALRVRMHRCIQRAQQALRELDTSEKDPPKV